MYFFWLNAYLKVRGDKVASYKEIVTKAIIGKGKKHFKDNYTLKTENTTYKGAWMLGY